MSQSQRRDGVSIQLDEEKSPREPEDGSPRLLHQRVGPPNAGFFELLLEAGGNRVTAARQRPDHDAFVGGEVSQNRSRHMAQSAGNLVSLNGVADRLGDDQSDPRSVAAIGRASCVHNKIRLRRSHPPCLMVAPNSADRVIRN